MQRKFGWSRWKIRPAQHALKPKPHPEEDPNPFSSVKAERGGEAAEENSEAGRVGS